MWRIGALLHDVLSISMKIDFSWGAAELLTVISTKGPEETFDAFAVNGIDRHQSAVGNATQYWSAAGQ